MTPNSGANLFAINHPSHLHLFALVQRGHIVGQIVRSSPNNLPTLILIKKKKLSGIKYFGVVFYDLLQHPH